MSHELIPTEAEEAIEGKAEQTSANEFIQKVENILFKKDSVIMNDNEDNDALNTSILKNSNGEDNNNSSIAPRIPNISPRRKYDQMISRRKSYNKQFSRGDYTPYSLDNSSSSPGDNTPYSPGDYTPFNNNNNTPSMAHKKKYPSYKEKWGIEESGFDSPANSQDGDTSTHMARKQRIQMISQIGLVDIDNEDHIKLIVEILKQKSRSSRELSFLRKAISYLSLFQNNPELLKRSSASQSIFSEFNYQFCQKNEVIFNQGDFGYTYYILLKGSVFLLIPKLSNVRERKDSTNRKKTSTGHNLPQSSSCISIASAHFIPAISKNKSPSEENEDNNNFVASAFNRSTSVKSKPKQSSQRQIHIPTTKGFQQEVEQNFSSFHRNNRVNTTEDQENDNEEDTQDKDSDILRNYEGFNLVKTFVAGEAFGEISLITKQRRTGTMVCREDSHLMTLTKLGFDKIMGSYHERIKTERLGFLRNFSFLKDIPESNLLSLLLDMRIKITPSKAVNFTQGSSVEDIFFLKTGIVQLSRTYEEDDEDQEQQQQQQLKSGILPDQLEKIQALNVATQKLKNKKKQKIAIIATLKDNSHFGLEDVLKEIKNPKFKSFHSMTAEVISETAELYILDKNIFLNNIGLFNSTDMFVEEIKKKLAYYANREKDVRETNKSSQLAMNRLLKLIAGKRQAEKNKEEQVEEEQDMANEDFGDKEENANSINNKNNRLNLSRSIHSPKKQRESKQKVPSTSPLRYIQQQQQQRKFQQLQLIQFNQQQQSQNPLQSPVLPFKNIIQQQQSLHQRQSFNFLDFVGTSSNCSTPLKPSDKTDFQKFNDKKSTQPQLVNYHPHPHIQPSQISSSNNNSNQESFSAALKLPIIDQNEYYKQENQMRASLLQEFSSKSCVSHRRQLMIKHCENDSFAERTNIYKFQVLQHNSTSRRTSRTGLTADPLTARTTAFTQGEQQQLLSHDLGQSNAGDNTLTAISTAQHNKKLQLVLRDDKKRIKELSEMNKNINIQNQAEKDSQKNKTKSRKSVKSSIDLSRIDINMFRINGSTSHRSPKTTHYSKDKRYSSCVNNGPRRQSNDNVGQNLVNFLSSRESVSRLYEDNQVLNNDGQMENDKEISFQINSGNNGKSVMISNCIEKEPQIRGNSCMLTGCNNESQNEDQLNLPEQRRRVIIIRSRFDEITQNKQSQQQSLPYSDNKSHSQSVSVNTSRTNIQLPSNLRVPANLHTLLLQNTPKPLQSPYSEIKTSQSSKAFNMHVQRAKKATQVPAGAAKMLLNQQSKLLLNKHDSIKLAQNPFLLLQPSPP